MPAASRPFFDADEMPAGIVVDEHARPETVEGAVLGVAVDWSALVGGEPELNPGPDAPAHRPRESLTPVGSGIGTRTGASPISGETHVRQVLLFGKEGQEKFANLQVGVVGAGGLGSIVIVLLVLLGVRRLVFVDPDEVEKTNLNRLFGARPEDAVQRVAKVEVMARNSREINPNVEVVAIRDTVLNEAVWQVLKTCDVLFGCTDSASSRVELNRRSIQYMIPYFDTGTGIEAASGQVQHAGGQVRVVIPGMGCLGCIEGLNRKGAREETLSEASRRTAISRGYITGADVPAPAVASLNTAVASLAVTEMMAFVTGVKPLNRYVFYDFLHACTKTVEFRRAADCLVCAPGGLLGAGDEGCPTFTSEESVLVQSSQGGRNVNKKETVVDLGPIAQALKARKITCRMDTAGSWLLLDSVTLGRGWSRPQSDVRHGVPLHRAEPVIAIRVRLLPRYRCRGPRTGENGNVEGLGSTDRTPRHQPRLAGSLLQWGQRIPHGYSRHGIR
jgi:molybdopterin/thiamine biosynthesis adenylyltransferase